jgi:hypothetical protein
MGRRPKRDYRECEAQKEQPMNPQSQVPIDGRLSRDRDLTSEELVEIVHLQEESHRSGGEPGSRHAAAGSTNLNREPTSGSL